MKAYGLLALLLVFGCANEVPATAVIVEVTADAVVRQRAEQLTMQVRSFAGENLRCSDQECWPTKLDGPALDIAELPMPVRVPIVPRDNDPSRTFEVIVDALAGGNVLVRNRAVAGFIAGEQRTLRIRLEGACTGDGDICEELDCHGTECEVCRGGDCRTVGLVDWAQPLDAEVPMQDAQPPDAITEGGPQGRPAISGVVATSGGGLIANSQWQMQVSLGPVRSAAQMQGERWSIDLSVADPEQE